MLERAPVWTGKTPKLVALRDSLSRPPVSVEITPGGTDVVATFSVATGPGAAAVTVVRSAPLPTSGAPIVSEVATRELTLAIVEVTEDPMPRHARQHLMSGKLGWLHSKSLTQLKQVADSLLQDCPD